MYSLNIRVAQMAKMCRTFRDQHFSHVFYLVILENGQKVQKSCCFRVPNCGWRNGWFYLMIPGQKWLFLHQLRFCPPICFGNTNKPLETTFHIPIPHPGPKEYQIWAFGGIFSTSNNLKSKLKWGDKSEFCFFHFPPIPWLQIWLLVLKPSHT